MKHVLAVVVNRKINPNGINATLREPRTGRDEPTLRIKTADFFRF